MALPDKKLDPFDSRGMMVVLGVAVDLSDGFETGCFLVE